MNQDDREDFRNMAIAVVVCLACWLVGFAAGAAIHFLW